MKKFTTFFITLSIGLLLGWNLKALFISTDIIQNQDDELNVNSLGNQPSKSLLEVLIENAPNNIYFGEDYDFNQQALEYLGQIGNYKVVKYQSEYGPGSKGNQKVIFYKSDNSFYGFYQPLYDLNQVYEMENNSLWIDQNKIDLTEDLPDSLRSGPDLWTYLRKE